MPEIAEVETVRLHVEKVLKGKRISKVLLDLKDRIAFDKQSPLAVRKALVGAKVTGTGRKGKYFWITLDRTPWPVIHLGMSGNVEIWSDIGFQKAWGGVKLWSRKNEKNTPQKLPRFSRLLLEMSDGTRVAITDPRRFGRVRLAQDPLNESPISQLGADPLEKFTSFSDLKKVLQKRKTPIKAMLLDQSLFAGIGNWLADEILFQSKISPYRLGKDLSDADVKIIRNKTLAIVRKAVQVQADYERFPKFWLFHDRWSKGQEETYHSHGYEIRHDTIGGRTAAWIPAVQI